MTGTPDAGGFIATGALRTHYHDIGTGAPLLLVHGSGPGVSAWANWRFTITDLADRFRCIAPDMAGFGQTRVGDGFAFGLAAWRSQLLDFLDALKLEKVDVVGNSFGGTLALALAIAAPERVGKLVLMGSVGVPFEITPGLDAVWGYTPGIDNMRAIMDYFAYDRSLLGEDLVRLRHEASIQPGVQESYAAMFPAPRQRWIDALAHDEADLRAIPHPTLIVHGRDDRVIPMQTSMTLNRLIDDSRLHVFGRCGHWTQIEQRHPFARLLIDFL